MRGRRGCVGDGGGSTTKERGYHWFWFAVRVDVCGEEVAEEDEESDEPGGV